MPLRAMRPAMPWTSAPAVGRGDRVQQREQKLAVVGVRRRDQHAERGAAPVAQDIDLRTRRAAIDRAGPVRPPLLRPCGDRVHHGTGPVDLADRVQPVQGTLVQLFRQSGSGLLGEPPMHGGAAGPEQRCRQLAPGSAGLRQVHDRRQDCAIVGAPPSTALRPLRRSRHQRLRHLP